MFLYRLKNFTCAVIAIIFSLFIAISVKATNVSRLSSIEGNRTFFLDSASSQGLMKTEVTLSELGRVKGECVSFSLMGYKGGRYASNEEVAESIIKEFDAKILIIEEIAGVTSYYCYTPYWPEGILIEGQRINLHVAVSNGQCTVGTPIIFGGF